MGVGMGVAVAEVVEVVEVVGVRLSKLPAGTTWLMLPQHDDRLSHSDDRFALRSEMSYIYSIVLT